MEEAALPAYFGEWLKRYRKNLNLTQGEVVERAGCSLPALRKIEAGERRPSKQLAELLAKSLNIPPEDQATFVRVARGELNIERLGSPDDTRPVGHSIRQPPVKSAINLPFQPTAFVGREAELFTLGQLLADPQCRLMTITGMGGIGKTRLAVELAYQQQSLFPSGVYFVSLASINAPDFIVPAVADILGFTFSGPLTPRNQLINHLAVYTKQPLLLIFDNLEHLLDPSVQGEDNADPTLLIAEMLQRISKLKVLTTSRERINIQGEWTFELHGLPFPALAQPDQSEIFSAPALFTQRARQVKADFEILPEDRYWLAKVCQLVEGSPLAIELAASWVGLLSIEEIAKEISANLDFLTTSMRGVSERHRSLRAAFEHSWKLLSIEEQLGLCRMAVFRGSFQREAAEQVAQISLTILMSLFMKSLLRRKENGRYDLHEVVRQFALSYTLEDPDWEATRDRHCKYYLDLVRGEEKGFSEANQWVGDQTLMDELDNLRAAISWGMLSSKVHYSLQIATALGQFWYTHGYWREGLEWLQRGLTAPEPVPDVVRAKALTVAGRLIRYLGDYPQAVAMLKESLEIWEKCEDKTGIAQTLCNLGAVVFRQGDIEAAISLLEEAHSVAIQQGDRRGNFCSLENLGHVASRQGYPHRAIEFYNASLALAREANDENQIANLLNAIGDEHTLLGDYDQAEHYLSMASEICRKIGNRLVGAYISGNRGFIALKQGRYSQALDALAETMLVLHEMGDKEEAILCFEPMAAIALKQDFPVRAARLLGAGESLRVALGVTLPQSLQADREDCTANVRGQLGEATFEAAWAEGSRLTYEQAITFAVNGSWEGH